MCIYFWKKTLGERPQLPQKHQDTNYQQQTSENTMVGRGPTLNTVHNLTIIHVMTFKNKALFGK